VRQIAAGSADGVAADAGAVWTIGGTEDGQADGTIFRIDDRTGSVDEVASGVGPMYGIAVGANGVWTIDGNSERTWEIDPDLLRVAAMIPLDHPPEFAAVRAGAVWLANADGTLSPVDGKTAAVVKTIPLGRYPRLAYPVGLAIGDGVVWVAVH
jgi:DNA-binding beta-propeller fold protein YncE